MVTRTFDESPLCTIPPPHNTSNQECLYCAFDQNFHIQREDTLKIEYAAEDQAPVSRKPGKPFGPAKSFLLTVS